MELNSWKRAVEGPLFFTVAGMTIQNCPIYTITGLRHLGIII